MVKDHSDTERGNLQLPHGLLFQLASKVLLDASSHRQDNTYYGFCYTSREKFYLMMHSTHFIYIYMVLDIW